MNFKKTLCRISTITNLHAGAGDKEFGIVDKTVQRDPITGFPVIHSSSLKGALRVYSQHILDFESDELKDVFGDENNPGTDIFLTAYLLTLPVRSNVRAFYKATCPAILHDFKEKLIVFGLDNGAIQCLDEVLKTSFDGSQFVFINTQSYQDGIIEDFPLKNNCTVMTLEEDKRQELKKILNIEPDEFVLVRDDIFKEISDSLPVIARNRLDDQRNLWYEEVVPRQTDFFFLHMTPTEQNDLIERINQDSKKIPVQIGANASIGYGFCYFEKILG